MKPPPWPLIAFMLLWGLIALGIGIGNSARDHLTFTIQGIPETFKRGTAEFTMLWLLTCIVGGSVVLGAILLARWKLAFSRNL